MTDSEWNPHGIRSDSARIPKAPSRPVPSYDFTVVCPLSYRDMYAAAAKTVST